MSKSIPFLLILFLPIIVSAHSGGTDTNGCHTNKKTGEYHCHTPKIQVKKSQPVVNKTKVMKANAPAPFTSASCTIKGNISSAKEKIYHVIGCKSYNVTKIDVSAGERWFCTEKEALDAGWRKALNCNYYTATIVV